MPSVCRVNVQAPMGVDAAFSKSWPQVGRPLKPVVRQGAP